MGEVAGIVIRSSQGSDDKISLDVQREKTEELAEDLGADETVHYDFGIHTGWSLFTRGVDVDDEKRIDQHPKMQNLIDDIRSGELDYLIAYDDTRIARDRFLVTVEHACIVGDCELHFNEEADTSDLLFWIKRFVETHAKLKEMRATLRALTHREENDYYQGRPRFGTEYDDAGQYLVPGDEFEDALQAIRLREQGVSYRKICERTSINSTSSVRTVLDSKQWYLDLAREHDVEPPDAAQEARDSSST